MIQPNEKLLPGNVVMYHAHQGDAPVSLWARRILDIVSLETYQRNHSPIPLTHEILDEYKIAEWSIYHQGWEMKYFVLKENHTGGFRIYSKSDRIKPIVDSIPDLHTLQNLIYFLSGEEMPVNIPNN